MFWGSKHLLKTFENINSHMSSNTDVSWPKLSFLDGEIQGNLTKTRSIALDDSGIIHALGYKSEFYAKTYTSLDKIEKMPEGYKGFVGTVECSDGNTYFLPAYTKSFGKLNRASGELTIEEKLSYSPQVRSGVEGLNGIIYMPSYTTNLRILTLNTKTGEIGSIIPEKDKRPGYMSRFGHIWGAATDCKGEIYMPPALNSSAAKIDKNGEFKYLEGPPITSGVSGFSVKYVGAIYVKGVNKVFCLPRTGKKILIINCSDDSYEEIDLPKDYLAVVNKNKNFHGYLAPDGWLYSAFWADTKCFRINPNTYEIQWKDYSEEFMDGKDTIEEGSGIMSIGTGFTTATITVGNSVYFGLAGTSKAVKLEFEPLVAKLPKPTNVIMSEIKINSNDITPGIRSLMGALLATDSDKEITITISSKDVPTVSPSPSPSQTPPHSLPVTPSVTPSMTPSITPTSSVTPSVTLSATPSITPTVSLSPSPSLVCLTPTVSPSPTCSCANYCTCSNYCCSTTTCYCSCNICCC